MNYRFSRNTRGHYNTSSDEPLQHKTQDVVRTLIMGESGNLCCGLHHGCSMV